MDNPCQISAATGLFGSNLAPRRAETIQGLSGLGTSSPTFRRVKSRRLPSVEKQRIATAQAVTEKTGKLVEAHSAFGDDGPPKDRNAALAVLR